jgi:hypothetical protein
MKRILSIVALVGLSGLGINLSAQQTPSQTPSQTPAAADSASPSTQTPSATSPDSSMPQSQTDAANAQQSARAFEGKITKSGDQFVLQETATQTSYKLDDQDKAKQFKGKNVKVMATVDASTNTLHVVDISPSESR